METLREVSDALITAEGGLLTNQDEIQETVGKGKKMPAKRLPARRRMDASRFYTIDKDVCDNAESHGFGLCGCVQCHTFTKRSIT